jgi:hypothetical protein
MGKNRVRRPQARKKFTRLGYNVSSIGVSTGTYIGGRDSRAQVRPVDTDE